MPASSLSGLPILTAESGCGANVAASVRRAEGAGDGFVPAEGEQRAAEGRFFFRVGKRDDGAGEGGQGIGEAVVAVDAGDFFDEIDLAFEVEPPAGESDLSKRLRRILSSLQPSAVRTRFGGFGGDAFGVFGRAEDALDFADLQADRGAIRGAGLGFGDDDVDEVAFDFAAGFEDDLGDEGVGDGRGVEVGSALEAVRGVGVQAVAAGAAADGCGIEPCGFDEDVFCFGGDHRVPTAHDSGDAERLDVVGDDKVFGIEGAFDSVEGAKLFAFAGAADDDAAFEFVEVEGVGGLADGEGDVVGGVDGVRDELLFEQAEAFGDDAVGGRDFDVAQNAGGEASAEFWGFDGDRIRRLCRRLPPGRSICNGFSGKS